MLLYDRIRLVLMKNLKIFGIECAKIKYVLSKMTKQEILNYCQDDIRQTLDILYDKGYNNGYKDANITKESDPLNRENVNFSLASSLMSNDERLEEFRKQRIERGFDDTELWDLNITIIKFILPRLKAFKECTSNYPRNLNSKEEWDIIIQSMIDYMQAIIDNNDELEEKYTEGWDNFHKYFFSLWC